MNVRPIFVGLTILVVAIERVPGGIRIAAVVALAALAVTGLALKARGLTPAALLLLLLIPPHGWSLGTPLPWLAGGMGAIALLLVLGDTGTVRQVKATAGRSKWLRRRAGWLTFIGVLGATVVAAPFILTTYGPGSIQIGEEWRGTYGIVFATAPVMAGASLVMLLRVFSGPSVEVDP